MPLEKIIELQFSQITFNDFNQIYSGKDLNGLLETIPQKILVPKFRSNLNKM